MPAEFYVILLIELVLFNVLLHGELCCMEMCSSDEFVILCNDNVHAQSKAIASSLPRVPGRDITRKGHAYMHSGIKGQPSWCPL